MVTFDTHAAIKNLMQKGMQEDQAEAIVHLITDSKDENAANKGDLREIGQRLLETEQRIKLEIAAAKFDLIKWVLPFLVGIILAIFFK